MTLEVSHVFVRAKGNIVVLKGAFKCKENMAGTCSALRVVAGKGVPIKF